MRGVIERLRKEYPVGTRVELVRMDDIQAPPIGTKGTVRGVDDIGSILVYWDNGSTLNVVYGEDECRKVAEAIQCCICGKWMTVKEANNAAPYTNGECCSECNVKVVLPHRLGLLNRTKPKED